MCVCLHVFTHVWVYKCVCILSHVYGCANVCAYFHTCMGVQMCVCMWGPEVDIGSHFVSFLAPLLRLSLSVKTQSLLMLLSWEPASSGNPIFAFHGWNSRRALSPWQLCGCLGSRLCDPDSCMASSLAAAQSAWLPSYFDFLRQGLVIDQVSLELT